jgi:hypothetical protein
MSYYLIIAFQAFCVYHLFKNRNSYYWIFAIVFLPVVGCAVYLATQVYKKRDAETIQGNLTSIINPTKRVHDLERKIKFIETYENRVNLGDEYFKIKDYPNAIVNYKKALEDKTQNDFYVQAQLIFSKYHLGEYDSVISDSELIKDTDEFKKAQLQYAYGMSLEHIGNIEEAELQLKQIDKPYSNYNERLALIQFLIRHDKKSEAKEILEEVHDEIQNMTKMNQKIYRTTILEVEKLKVSM